MEAINAKLATLKAETLIEMARKLSADLSSEATIVLDAIMFRLEGLMPEGEFIALCEEM